MLDKPDMNVKCANYIVDLASKSSIVLEWGSGGSTIAMSNSLRDGCIIYSFEHDLRFYNMVNEKLNRYNVRYTLATTKKDYVYSVKDVHYSFILVDGIYREECMKYSKNVLSWDILLLHDAERERYKPWMDLFSSDRYTKLFIENLWVCKRRQ